MKLHVVPSAAEAINARELLMVERACGAWTAVGIILAVWSIVAVGAALFGFVVFTVMSTPAAAPAMRFDLGQAGPKILLGTEHCPVPTTGQHLLIDVQQLDDGLNASCRLVAGRTI